MSFWHRLEPTTIDADVEEGIEARVADPLWMLARQWQLGEFKGEDAASPVHVHAQAESFPIASFRNDAVPGAAVEPFRSTHPLECRVEAESVLNGPSDIAIAAEAGTQFLRRLEYAALAQLRRDVDWRAHFGFDLQADGVNLTHLPERTQRRLTLFERRALDGRKLFDAGTESVQQLVPDGQQSAVAAVYRAWLDEYQDRFREPGDSGDCWLDERLEYRFSLGVPTREAPVLLAADEYHGGHLDWYTFRVVGDDSHGLKEHAGKQQRLDMLPQPVMFRGQGAPRWWEFEDRSVYFGNLSAGPADVARLVVAEFATVFSDDWYIVPLTVDVGTLNRVNAITVIDVFGGTTAIRSTAVEDEKIHGAARPFRMFELDGDNSAQRQQTPWLLVSPTLADSLNGQAVEDVSLMRDEGANLGWAVERAIELPTGESMPRRRQWRRATSIGTSEADAVVKPTGDMDDPWRYRLQTAVPPWWIPLVPERIGDGAEIRLRRARLQSWETLDPELVGAKGRLMGVRKALRLFEEEVPRGGVQVTRGWQRTRGADGRVHLWMARRKRPGRGDRGSGLEFDVIEWPDA